MDAEGLPLRAKGVVAMPDQQGKGGQAPAERKGVPLHALSLAPLTGAPGKHVAMAHGRELAIAARSGPNHSPALPAAARPSARPRWPPLRVGAGRLLIPFSKTLAPRPTPCSLSPPSPRRPQDLSAVSSGGAPRPSHCWLSELPVSCLCLYPRHTTLLSGTTQGEIHIWYLAVRFPGFPVPVSLPGGNVRSRSALPRRPEPPRGPPHRLTALPCLPSPHTLRRGR